MAEEYNTDWTGVRVTDKRAVPIQHQLENVHVVFVEEGRIRGAEFKKAHFLLPQGELHFSRSGTKERVEVQCLWYGRKPPSTWMHITFLTKPVEKKAYSGPVIVDFGRP